MHFEDDEKITPCPECGADDYEYVEISTTNGAVIRCSECVENGYVKRKWVL